MATKVKEKQQSAMAVVRKHFGRIGTAQIVTASRSFPLTARVDVQRALDEVFAQAFPSSPIGVHAQYMHETLSFSRLMTDMQYPVLVGPLQFDEVDVGTHQPARCLRHAVWLAADNVLRFAVLATPEFRYGQVFGVHVEVAVPPGEPGAALSHLFLQRVEKFVQQAGTYRGKTISLEESDSYAGQGGVVRVHRLEAVSREQVILPKKTVELLDRNVLRFVEQRDGLRQLGLPVKKGLLLYGPPGTGKTHTIRYLATQLPHHTTLLITAEQVALFDRYVQLARFLQPSIVVVEDVDLIARSRDQMHSACEESLLNKLLNEMDGLREDAAILFVLTTNRPEQLERALASRPGRIDQAIEFPLPDAEGRRKLVYLYARELPLTADLAANIVERTENGTPAFIKELMRRCAQYYISSGETGGLRQTHVEAALEEILFSGGSLNLKLLGVGSISASAAVVSATTAN